jgi:hypothetical protein
MTFFLLLMSKTLFKGGMAPKPIASAGTVLWSASLHLRVQILMASGRSPHLSSPLSLLLGSSINYVGTKKWPPHSVPHFHLISCTKSWTSSYWTAKSSFLFLTSDQPGGQYLGLKLHPAGGFLDHDFL